jgi:pyridoxal phosphate enzyme (YggS family)
MSETANRLAGVTNRIQRACERAGRDPAEVGLIAVSKRQPVEAIREAFEAGQTAFGENYLQEGLDKQQALADLPINWHFVGPLQSNKTKMAAEHFDWVHTLDRYKIAQRLSRDRQAAGRVEPLDCCIQVNVSGEASKSGVSPEDVGALAHDVAALPGLRLRGLMTLPEAAEDETRQRTPFAHLREFHERLRAEGLALDTLSMGMSGDLEAAILEGATLVRIGSAVFGPRD